LALFTHPSCSFYTVFQLLLSNLLILPRPNGSQAHFFLQSTENDDLSNIRSKQSCRALHSILPWPTHHPPASRSPLGPDIFLNTLCSDTRSLYAFLGVRDQGFTPIQNDSESHYIFDCRAIENCTALKFRKKCLLVLLVRGEPWEMKKAM
jgi:hypothetical protein